MASLKALQKKAPGAETVAGRVVVYVNGKHVDLGQYVGEDAVVLSQAGEALLNPPKQEEAKKPAKASKGLDVGFDDLEV